MPIERKITADETGAFILYAKLRMEDKMTVMEVYEHLGKVYNCTAEAARITAHKRKWASRVTDLLPSILATVPTTTTTLKVIDEQRKEFLSIAREMTAKWRDGMKYISLEFAKAKRIGKPERVYQALQAMNTLALYAQRAQAISGHATCDSGASTAVSEDGAPSITGNVINIHLPKQIATPRVPNTLPEKEAKAIQL